MEPYENSNLSGQPENPQQPEQPSQPENPQQPEQPQKPKQTVVLNQAAKKKSMPGWVKGLIIFGVIVVCVVLLTVGCNKTVNKVTGSLTSQPTDEVVTDFGHDYIGTLYIDGTIDEYGTGTYNHQYLLNAIDAMMTDSNNKGMILSVNTPGGSVYASDELYLKIREYQDTTGRPVYSAMQSQATSGGYYISASCDKIIANRNCWTGSIGVTMGTLMDISELLENLGIKTNTITSGANKAMGSSYEAMTEEQREIFQSLIDEAYDQFVGIVADGREMSEKEVRKIADGRIYTAKQALDNGLIDAIGTMEDAVQDMQSQYGLQDCAVEDFIPEAKTDLSDLLGIVSSQNPLSGRSDAALIEELVALNGTFRVSYIASVKK
ncbi:MAG: signal peptide peptidase SppA [Anaerovoracaceae bacterium]